MRLSAFPDPAELGDFEVFRDLSSAQLHELNERFRRMTFPPGANIAVAERAGDIVYFVLSGTMKVEVIANGSCVILAIVGPGEIVGETSLADSLGRSASIVTMEECEVAWVDGAVFQRWANAMPQLTQNIVGILSRRLRLANAQVQALSTLDVFGRIAYQLLALAQEFGETSAEGVSIPIRLTQEDLAGLVGASRVRVNQAVVTYKRLGYISVDGGHRITIHDPAALSRNAGVQLPKTAPAEVPSLSAV